MHKPVVLIGGASGTGKSRLAGELSARFGFDHRLGTGFIRAILQSEVDPAVEPRLFSHTFRARDPVSHMEWQAGRLHGAVTACVDRAHLEGTSLIIEGSHLIPRLYARAKVDLFIVLAAPDESEHLARLTGSAHTLRQISDEDVVNIQRLDAYYVKEASAYQVKTVVFGESLDPIVDLLGPVVAGPLSPGPLMPERR